MPLRPPAITAADIDWFVPHQANKRIIDGSAHKLGIAPEKVVVTVDRHGNTSAASIPLALADAVADRRIKRGNLDPFGSDGRGVYLGFGAFALVSPGSRNRFLMLWLWGLFDHNL